MTKIRSTRRQQSYASFKAKNGTIQDADRLFSLQLTDTQLQEFYSTFHEDANANNNTSDWGRERRRAADQDIMYKGDRTMLSEHIPETKGGKWYDRVHNKVDFERGRFEEDDIMPGVIRTSTGYQCSKFVPGEGVYREWFVTKQSALAWMDRMNTYYNGKAR